MNSARQMRVAGKTNMATWLEFAIVFKYVFFTFNNIYIYIYL